MSNKIEIDQDFLYQKYVVEKLNLQEIAGIIGCSDTTIRRQMKHYNIPRRNHSEALLCKERSRARCHPDREHFAKGLCKTCYYREWGRQRRINNPDHMEYQREYQRKYRETPEGRKYFREYSRVYQQSYSKMTKVKNYRRDWLLRNRFGITIDEYNDILNKQDGVCAICGKTPEENRQNLSVDHDHITGEIRGLLCGNCNRALGLFQEDTTVLQEAIKYLIRQQIEV